MRRNFWILLGLLAAIGVPACHADSYAPVFTCVPCTSPLPTAPDVTFTTGSTIDITWENNQYVFSLEALGPEYTVTWYGNTPFLAEYGTAGFELFLFVATAPFVYDVDNDGNCLNCGVMDHGTMSFVDVDAPATPEPSSVVLMLSGMGLLAAPKRFVRGRRQAAR